MLKKLIKTFITTTILSISMLSISFGGGSYQQFKGDSKLPYGDSWLNENPSGSIENPGDLVDRGEDSIIIRLLDVFGLDSSTTNEHKFIDYARAILNMALGLISIIALIMTIYTFYMMFFTDNEAGTKKAKGNLIGIFIALGIIGLAWIIVSFIFRWYQNNWTPSVAGG